MSDQTQRSATSDDSPFVDKCAICETYVVVGSVADLRRRMNAHELEEHGRIEPTRASHRSNGTR